MEKSELPYNECNEECSSLQQILKRGDLSGIVYKRIDQKYCIYYDVHIDFSITEIFPINESFFPRVLGPDRLISKFYKKIHSYICAVLTAGSYGIISLPAII